MNAQVVQRLPLGVAILAILIGVFGFFVLAVGLLALLVGAAAGFGSPTTVFGLTGTIAALILVLIGAIVLAVASGLWDQELWALALAIIVLLFYGLIEFLSTSWLGLLIVTGLLAYLVAVSDQFQ
jgi:hypothetical protein